jgi:hypothetical protein
VVSCGASLGCGKRAPAQIVDNLGDAVDALKAERDENTCRKDLTFAESMALGQAIEALEKPKAKERQEATRAKKGEKVGAAQGGGKLPQPSSDNGKTRDKVAEAIGMSGPAGIALQPTLTVRRIATMSRRRKIVQALRRVDADAALALDALAADLGLDDEGRVEIQLSAIPAAAVSTLRRIVELLRLRRRQQMRGPQMRAPDA